ncbi:MAG: T9SS type A sorting domain-containing protein [Bacteroidota bacterium]
MSKAVRLSAVAPKLVCAWPVLASLLAAVLVPSGYAQSFEALGDLASGTYDLSSAEAVSADGSVVSGILRTTGSNNHELYWTDAAGTIRPIRRFISSAFPVEISADGQHILTKQCRFENSPFQTFGSACRRGFNGTNSSFITNPVPAVFTIDPADSFNGGQWTILPLPDPNSAAGGVKPGEIVSGSLSISADGRTIHGELLALYGNVATRKTGDVYDTFLWVDGELTGTSPSAWPAFTGADGFPGFDQFEDHHKVFIDPDLRIIDASDDGRVLTGIADPTTTFTPVRVVNGATETIPVVNVNFRPIAVSADGSVVIGRDGKQANDLDERIARYANGATTILPQVSPARSYGFTEWRAEPLGTNADGTAIVGYEIYGNERSSNGNVQGTSRAMRVATIWTLEQGSRAVQDVLIDDFGLDLTGWRLIEATAVSDDGTVVVGNGINPNGQLQGWRANLAPSEGAMRYELDLEAVVPEAAGKQAGTRLTSATDDTLRVTVGDSVRVRLKVFNTGKLPLANIRIPRDESGIQILSDELGALRFARGERLFIDRLEPDSTADLLFIHEAVSLAENVRVFVPRVEAEAIKEDSTRQRIEELVSSCGLDQAAPPPALSAANDDDSIGCARLDILSKILVVNTTGDEANHPDSAEEEVCDVDRSEDGEQCTLRAAIEAVNGQDGTDPWFITFDIPADDSGCADGVCTIRPAPLPPIERPVVIRGTSQPGYANPAAGPLIVVSGEGSTSTVPGLQLAGSPISVSGLTLRDFNGPALQIDTDAQVDSMRVVNNSVGIRVARGADAKIGTVPRPDDEAVCLSNLIAGNTVAGIHLAADAREATVRCAVVGVLPGADATANQTGILIEGPDHIVTTTTVSGNTGIGIHVKGAAAVGNTLSENIIGAFDELGTTGNRWGIVIESASNTTIGQPANSNRPVDQFLRGNREGEILIVSEDADAPADGNVLHRNALGTDLGRRLAPPRGSTSRTGVAIMGAASFNSVGRATSGEAGFSNIIGGYFADVAIAGAEGLPATGNRVLSTLFGIDPAVTLIRGTSLDAVAIPPDVGGSIDNIVIYGAASTQIGATGGTEVVLGNATGSGIEADGRVPSEVLVTPTRSNLSFTGSRTETRVSALRVRNVIIPAVFRDEGDRFPLANCRDAGIDLYRFSDVVVGPDLTVSACREPGEFFGATEKVGIRLFDVQEATITGTTFLSRSLWLGRNQFDEYDKNGVGVVAIGTEHVRVSSGGASGLPNSFYGLETGIRIGGGDAPTLETVIEGNVFGDGRNELVDLPSAQQNRFGIVLRPGATNTRIGGTEEGLGNQLARNDMGIRLEGPGSYPPRDELLPVQGTVITGNVFGEASSIGAPGGDRAVSIHDAVDTRIGGALGDGATGSNRINNYGTAIVVVGDGTEVDGERGTVILGNNIVGVERVGILPTNPVTFSTSAIEVRRPMVDLLGYTEVSTVLNTTQVLDGAVLGPPNQTIHVQIFGSVACRGVAEGETLLATTTTQTNGLGLGRFRLSITPGDNTGLTATATDDVAGRTGPFSACFSTIDRAESRSVPFDQLDDEVFAELPGFGKHNADSLFVTSYDAPPPLGTVSGEVALNASGETVQPTMPVLRAWRLGLPDVSGQTRATLCLTTEGLNAPGEVVIIRQHLATGMLWTPLDTRLETLEGRLYACADEVTPQGLFSFGEGGPPPLAPPGLSFPDDGAPSVRPGVELTWGALPEAVSYDLEIALDRGFGAIHRAVDGLTNTRYVLDSLAVSQQVHYWRVRGVAAQGEVGAWSVPFTFASRPLVVAIDPREATVLPETVELQANYPNPFNPVTTIGYALPEAGLVRLVVFDLMGREVQVLVDGPRPAGQHEVTFEARRLSSGTYLYRLEAANTVRTGRMVLLK